MTHCRQLALIAGLFALACTPSSTTEQPPNEQPSEPPKQAEPSASSIQLSQAETKIEVETGTELRYSFKSHASVGVGAKFEIADPSVLEHLRTDMEYAQSEEERAGKDGADAATATYVFKAKSAGSSSLKITEHLRGKPQQELEFSIKVVDP